MTDFGYPVYSLEFLSEIPYSLFKYSKELICYAKLHVFGINISNNQSNQHPSVLQYIQVTQNLYIKLFV